MSNLVEQREFASVSSLEILRGKDFAGRSGGYEAHVQEQNMVEVLRDCLEVVMDDQGRFATGT